MLFKIYILYCVVLHFIILMVCLDHVVVYKVCCNTCSVELER